MVRVFLVTSFFFNALAQQPAPEKPRRGWLTVDTIMRDQKWMGISPSRPFWSEDGEWLYFTWAQGAMPHPAKEVEN
jgi:hypothetical protein